MSDQLVEDFPIEMVGIGEIQPHPRNYRVHPQEQIEHLIESIRANGFYRPIVTAQDGTILAGHGVVIAARAMGLERVPIRRLPIGPDDPKALKLLTGDNEISHLGEVDDRALGEILRQIKMEDAAGLLGTGYDDKMLAELIMATRTPDEEGNLEQETGIYTSRIEIPTYQPTEEKPLMAELFDDDKTRLLVQRINATEGLTEEERDFLIMAAQRHTVLHFNRIADYYAHARQEVQDLMEESALVIIDFERAVELGYVELTQRLAAMVGEEYGD